MAGPSEQPLPPDVIGREDAVEVLRAFVVDGGLSIAFQRAFEEPDMWGMLLVDIARHAARAYARESGYTEDEALTRIVDMFEAEINRPTDMGSTTSRSQMSPRTNSMRSIRAARFAWLPAYVKASSTVIFHAGNRPAV